MARLQTVGFETQQLSSTASVAEARGVSVNGAVAITTSTVRSGLAAASCGPATYVQITADNQGNAFASGVTNYYLRAFVKVDQLPSADATIISLAGSGGSPAVKIKTTGALALFNSTSQVGSDSAVALSPGVWYRVEFHYVVNGASGLMGLLLDGATVAADTTSNIGSLSNYSIRVGSVTTATGMTVTVDDVALNNDSGVDQSSWPGDGKIIHLLPASDSARGGWVAGAGGTANLFVALDNVPPVGVAVASATNTSQIKNTAFNAADNYDANATTYSAAGLLASDTITLVLATAQIGADNSGTVTSGVSVVSNPACSETTLNPAAIAATSPSNWRMVHTSPTYAPSVTLGTAPVVRIGKRTSTSSAAMCDYLAVVVEYVPSAIPPIPNKAIMIRDAVRRSFSW
jgi:hypothetical protein